MGSGCSSVDRASVAKTEVCGSNHVIGKLSHGTFIYCQRIKKARNKGKRVQEWPIQK